MEVQVKKKKKEEVMEAQGRTKSEETLRFTVHNISKMEGVQLSAPQYVQNLPWNIMAERQPKQSHPESYLGFFLECNKESESTSWNCYAEVELRLLSCKPGQNFSRRTQHFFSSKVKNWGFKHFINWQNVIDPDKGYIENDSITLEVHLVADPPVGVVYSSLDTGGKSEETFRFTIHKVSELKKSQQSPPCYVRNLPWNIMFERRSNQNSRRSESHLAFFLQCNKKSKSTSWQCNAVFELRLLSYKPGQKYFSRKEHHLFCSKENDWGFDKFMNWEEVFNSDKHYVKSDSITLEVNVVAESPVDVCCDSELETGGESETTCRFKVGNVSKKKDDKLSVPCKLGNFLWKIMVMPRSMRSKNRLPQKSLGFFLECNNESKSTSWNCYADVELRLLSNKSGQEHFNKKFQHIFCSEVKTWGLNDFMMWEDILDPEKGYIKDDSIWLEVFIDIRGRSQATFSFTIDNVSKMENSQFSPACYVRNLPWKIKANARSSGSTDQQLPRSFGFFLECNSQSKSIFWSCYAEAELSLLSRKPRQKNFSRKLQHLFCERENNWGFHHFIDWQDVLDPKKGYIKNDSITLEVHIEADEPHNVE